jgi:L-malate glycosyltransferase
MGNSMRRIAVVGPFDVVVAEHLREHGYRVESVAGDSVVGLARELLRMRPAAVHARESHLKAGLVARLLDVPLVVHARRSDVNPLTARAARMATRAVCGSAAVREALLNLGAPGSTTTVMRGLLGADDLGGKGEFPPVLDRDLRWVVSATPCDGPDRGHGDLLLAFLSVARTRPTLRLLVAGSGQHANALAVQAEHASAAHRVVVQPLTLEHLPAILSRAAVVVAPSRSGSLPDPVPEALALGAPVVATAVGLHPTWIREGRTGWLVPPRAPAALAARIAHVVDHEALAARVGEAAKNDARELCQPRALSLALSRTWTGVARLSPARSAGIYLPGPATRAARA